MYKLKQDSSLIIKNVQPSNKGNYLCRLNYQNRHINKIIYLNVIDNLPKKNQINIIDNNNVNYIENRVLYKPNKLFTFNNNLTNKIIFIIVIIGFVSLSILILLICIYYTKSKKIKNSNGSCNSKTTVDSHLTHFSSTDLNRSRSCSTIHHKNSNIQLQPNYYQPHSISNDLLANIINQTSNSTNKTGIKNGDNIMRVINVGDTVITVSRSSATGISNVPCSTPSLYGSIRKSKVGYFKPQQQPNQQQIRQFNHYHLPPNNFNINHDNNNNNNDNQVINKDYIV